MFYTGYGLDFIHIRFLMQIKFRKFNLLNSKFTLAYVMKIQSFSDSFHKLCSDSVCSSGIHYDDFVKFSSRSVATLRIVFAEVFKASWLDSLLFIYIVVCIFDFF